MTVCAPARVEERLTGQHVKLWPYVRALMPPDILYQLWALMLHEQARQLVFQSGQTEVRGDLVDALTYFNDEDMVLLLVTDTQGAHLLGACWFHDFVDRHRAFASVFVRRSAWGRPAREASRLAIAYAFEVVQLDNLWCASPWPIAIRHAEALGFQEVARLPEYHRTEQGTHDTVILRLRQEDWHG